MKLNYLLFLLLSIVFFSCEFDEGSVRYNMGADFISDPTGVYMIDTLTVNTYTTLTDSITTSQVERLLTGRFSNKLGVVTTCEAYFRLDQTSQTDSVITAVFDSACFIFYPDKYHFGDTTKISQLGIFPLTEEMVVNKDDDFIYNNDNFGCETAPIATFNLNYNVSYDPYRKENLDSVVVRVNDDYGKKFFDMVQTEDTILYATNKDNFNHKFKGYVIKPITDQNSFVAGFWAQADTTVTPKLRVYYHDITINDDLYFDYNLEDYTSYSGDYYKASTSNANSYLFSNITNDYRNSLFKGIDQGKDISENKLSSDLTSNVTLLQGGMDLRTRIELPTIDNLYALGIGSVVKAILYIEPMEGSYGHSTDLPTSLQLFLVDKINRSYGQMQDFDQQTIITSNLNYNKEFTDQTYYYIDITRFLRDEYMSTSDPVFSLQLAFNQSKVHSAVDQVILKNQHYSKNSVKLKLYLTNYSNFDLKQ